MTDTPPKSWSREILVLLEGDLSELGVLRVAGQRGDAMERPPLVSWLDGRSGAGRPLLSAFAGDAGFRELDPESVPGLLQSDGCRAVILSQRAWRSRAHHLWRHLQSSTVYICNRSRPSPRRFLCCADTPEAAARMRGRVSTIAVDAKPRVTVLQAVPPPAGWALAMGDLYGIAAPPPPRRDMVRREDWGETIVMDWTPPDVAVRAACSAVRPDLVVVGWHRHHLPLPDRILHPTAWRLSTELPYDTLLLPLDGGR
ncbi:MAG TPA: universal stress protein [Candidatus Dormibacteraeota bacterium]|nr:universal stress protein [Candidatus Dormibacteraeota bacterium]